ncbi:MAG: dTDP-4-dehydrorhamnose reductase [Terrimesophilobacter sp.]
MTFLITGANGMLGQDVHKALADRTVTALGRAELDITDADAVTAATANHDVIINCAAYTRVDDAETHESDAYAINATGAANLARAAAQHSATVVQVSTDYVFDGTATSPYPEDAALAPVSAYGRTKAEGERLSTTLNPGRTLVLRTAWIYGAAGNSFPKTMLRLARDRDTVSVVSDQFGQPSWTVDVADQLVRLLDAGVTSGTWHATNAGKTTWFEFARAVFSLAGLDPDRVKPTSSAEFARPAPRPSYSVLGHAQWQRHGFAKPRDWRAALEAAAQAGVFQQP